MLPIEVTYLNMITVLYSNFKHINVMLPVLGLAKKLKRYLDNPEELEKVSYRGWMLMQKYTQEWYASVFINNISKIIQ